MAKQEQHLTTARLSAQLDGQLSSAEQAQSEAHLQTCGTCQQQLAELRQTVALLRALPQPRLPRSFTLSTADATLPQHIAETARPLAPIVPRPLRPKRSGWPPYIAGAVRVISTLAAVLGIVFLLSSLFGTIIGVPSSSNVATTAAPANPQKPQVVTPRFAGVATPTPTIVTTPTLTSPPNSPVSVAQHFFALNLASTRALLGLALLLLGIVGFIVVARRL